MKHRGVRIVRVKYLAGIDIGKMEDSPVKAIIGKGYAVIGSNYPSTLEEVKRSIDDLIEKVMECCGVNEEGAVKLLNETA